MDSKKIRHLEKKDHQFIWHPFTQMQDWEKESPLIIEKGKGNYLIDIHGKKYLDGVSSLWVTVHGHRKKPIDQAIKKQISKISHSTFLGLSNVPAIQLAEQLMKIAPPNLKKVFYSDNGSTAVEIALKMAFQYWRQRENCAEVPRCRGAEVKDIKNKETIQTYAPTHPRTHAPKTQFLAFRNAYHGDTLGSVSVGGIDLFHQIYKPLLFDALHADFENAEDMIRANRDILAAVIIEPLVQGAAGMQLQPSGFLKKLRRACDENNVLLIFDEVATGFGRTGKMFACEHEKVWPDLMCVAKGITGGYLPLAATLTTQEIYDAFLDADCSGGMTPPVPRTFFHGHTYTGNPLACAAALANLEVFKKEKTLQKLQPKIRHLSKGLKKFWSLKHVGEIRQLGFMVGIELVAKRKINGHDKTVPRYRWHGALKDDFIEPSEKITECRTMKCEKVPYPPEARIGPKVIMEARKMGVILRPLGNVIVLMPPLSLSVKEMDFLLDTTYRAIQNVCLL